MSKNRFALIIAVLTFLVGVAVAKLTIPFSQRPSGPSKKAALLTDYKFTGPFEHENLTIFLIHGPDQPINSAFTPLQEAMERKIVKVYETQEVNELAIENSSPSEEVFVQAGDIVKGGQQDRVLAVDLIVPARSGKISIDAFCVDQGRWHQRGSERLDQFSISSTMLPNNELKIATRADPSQAKVWEEVDNATSRLRTETAALPVSSRAGSSLQLALEDNKVQESSAPYQTKLLSIVEGESDVIGFAFAINNKLNAAEVYASNAMFRRFWPRLLKTAAIEALSQRLANKLADHVVINAVNEFLGEVQHGVESLIEVTERTHMVKRELTVPVTSDDRLKVRSIENAVATVEKGEDRMVSKGVFFETRDMAQKGAWLHRSYVTR